MKKIISILVMMLLAVSCGTTKHIQESRQTSSVDSTTTAETLQTKTERFVDTTRYENGTVTITEIEFFDIPGMVDDTLQKGTSVVMPTNAALPNVGNFSGVKKLKQTTIEQSKVEKGESKEVEDKQQSNFTATNKREESNVQTEEEPAPDPYRWRYIFYLSVVALIILLTLKRSKLVNIAKKFMEFFKRIF